MSGKDASLYGERRHKKALSGKDTPLSGTNLAFSSALASLISAAPTSATRSRARPSAAATKDDIFKSQNRNVKKRAAADMLAHEEEMSAARMDDAAWRRTKRKLEEKARLYAAMKRGDVEDENGKHMVDFDRKWAEDVDAGQDAESEDESEDEEERQGTLVEYVDEFGRTRKGTRGQAAREERRKKWAAGEDSDRFTARPLRPDNIILGNTVQTSAFNPDSTIAEQMQDLAAKRDREATPPEAVHYHANGEVRTKGTGFFQFSEDEATRQEQLRELERERQETENARAERDKRRQQRQTDIEDRRRMIQRRRGQMQADKFLNELSKERVNAPESSGL